ASFVDVDVAGYTSLTNMAPPYYNKENMRFDEELHAQSMQLDGLCVLGDLDARKQFRQPMKSAIIPSPLHGIFPPTSAPAKLRCGEWGNPLISGILKQVSTPVLFDSTCVSLAVASYIDNFCSRYSPYCSKGVLSVSEVLNGVPGLEYIRPLELNTSPGWPYILDRRFRGKLGFVEGEVGSRVLTPSIQSALENLHDGFLQGVIPTILIVDCLKDERRPLAKVAAGNTRVFNVVPFDLNILLKQYFGSFLGHMMFLHHDTECAVGINPHGAAWSFQGDRLSRFPSFVDGDFSSFDKRLSYQVGKEFAKIANAFYRDEFSMVRELLVEVLLTSFHLAGKTVYKVYAGNPSGNALTTILNTVVNGLYLRLAYLEMFGSLQTFDAYVVPLFYGDDFVFSVRPDIGFSFHALKKIYGDHGLAITPSTKDGCDYDYLLFSDVSFLKRKFVRHDGVWKAPLSYDVICESLNWIRVGHDPIEALQAVVDSALLEMSHYGNEKYDSFVEHLRVTCFSRKISLQFDDFETTLSKLISDFAKCVILPFDKPQNSYGNAALWVEEEFSDS
ncbi:MAG: RNA-dependent RNA polymerase family protein, partial [Candidatus Bathyarchaeota archaeon]|nr:RNA-dependent RNA polymerase family protein [Candidatus Bathyarchaeum sp.]